MAIYMMRNVNTYLAHYPLTTTSTTSDTSGNSKNMTQSGTVTYGNYNGVNCAYFNGGYLYLNESLVSGANPRTISCWFNRTSALSNGGAFWGMGSASSENGITTYLHGNAPATGKYGYGNWGYDRDVGFNQSPSLNTWYLLTATYDGTDLLLYVNGSYLGTPTIGTYAGTNTITLNLTSGKTTICCMPNLGGTGFNGYMSDFIFDGVAWTAQEILDYYNNTKSTYGITDYEYSYNFVGKTTSQMESDGWNFFYQKGYVTFNSNGINSSTSSDSIMVKMENLSTIMPSAKKVTLSMTSYFSGYFSSRISLYNTATSSTRSGVTGNRAGSSQQQIQTTLYGTNATGSSNVSGNLTVTSVFDLVNGVWTTTGSNGYSDTGAISSTKIGNIRNDINGFYISAGWVDPGNSSGGLTSINLKIEL